LAKVQIIWLSGYVNYNYFCKSASWS